MVAQVIARLSIQKFAVEVAPKHLLASSLATIQHQGGVVPAFRLQPIADHYGTRPAEAEIVAKVVETAIENVEHDALISVSFLVKHLFATGEAGVGHPEPDFHGAASKGHWVRGDVQGEGLCRFAEGEGAAVRSPKTLVHWVKTDESGTPFWFQPT